MSQPRELRSDDAEAYVALRREMLADAPWSFLASPEQDRGSNVELVRASIGQPGYAIIGVFEDTRLVGAAGLRREDALKRAHLATVWGVYTTPSARGRGHARATLLQVIGTARSWPGLAALQLAVSENAPVARRLYESLGFAAWGVEPDAVRVDGRAYAEIHMRLPL